MAVFTNADCRFTGYNFTKCRSAYKNACNRRTLQLIVVCENKSFMNGTTDDDHHDDDDYFDEEEE